jgi:hypothetical protein
MTATQVREREQTASQPATASAAMTAPVQTPIAVVDNVDVPALIRDRDNEVMLAAFMGEVVDTWFYEFEIAGKKVEGVGVNGAEAFARIQADRGCPIVVAPYGIDIRESTQNDERGVRATITMRDARTKRESVGTAFYPYFLKKRDGSRTFDDKADRKALSVAKRNAILDLIPQEEVLAVLKARKQLIAQNRARIEAVTQRAIAAAPEVATYTVSEARKLGGEPYAPELPRSQRPRQQEQPVAPKKLGPRASEEQIEKLLNLIEEDSVNEKTKEAVTEGLKTGVTENQAKIWIDQLQEWIASAGKESPETLPLGAR